MIVVDESGVSTRLTRGYGRALRGQRVEDATPQARWQTVTLLGALGLEGLAAAMTVEGACDGEAFRAFLDQVLGPRLGPGQVVAMDNLSVHKVPGVRERIEARGAQLWYLSRYSPDLGPIEPCWSKVKTARRAAKARTHEALDEAVTAALATVTLGDARGWFRHCGYPAC